MDPNETLRKLRELAEHVGDSDEQTGSALELADLFEALDNWLSSGGFFPSSWGERTGDYLTSMAEDKRD